MDGDAEGAYQPRPKAGPTTGDVRAMNAEVEHAQRPTQTTGPKPYEYGQGLPHADAPAWMTQLNTAKLQGPQAVTEAAAQGKPYTVTTDPGRFTDDTSAYPNLPAPRPADNVLNDRFGAGAPLVTLGELEQGARNQPGAAPASGDTTFDFTNKPDTSTARQVWNWANRGTAGAPATMAHIFGKGVQQADDRTGNVLTKPVTERLGLGNPKLRIGTNLDAWSGGALSRHLSPEVVGMADLDSSPATALMAAPAVGPAARGFKTMARGTRPAAVVEGAAARTVPAAEAAGVRAGTAAAETAAPAAASTAAEAAAPVARTSLLKRLTNPGWKQQAVEVATGAAPITNTVRTVGHAGTALGKMVLGREGALTSLGNAFRTGTAGVVGSAYAGGLQGLAGGLRGESPGTDAYRQRLAQDPTAEAVDLNGLRTNRDNNTVNALWRTVTNGADMLHGSVAGDSNSPSVGQYYRNFGRDLGTVAGSAVRNPAYAADRVGAAVGDVANAYAPAGSGVFGSPSKAEYMKARADWDQLVREHDALPRTPENETRFAEQAGAIKDRVGKLDVAGDAPELAHHRAGIELAYRDALKRYGSDPAAVEQLKNEYQEQLKNMDAGLTAYPGKSMYARPLLVPTARDVNEALSLRGIVPEGQPGRAVADLTDAKRQEYLEAISKNPVLSRFDAVGRQAPVAAAVGAGAGALMSNLGQPPSVVGAPTAPGASAPPADSGVPAPGPAVAGPAAPGADAAPNVDPVALKTNIGGLISAGGGTVQGGLQAAAEAAPPPGFGRYWAGLDPSSKMLAIGGLSLAAISMLKNMFGGDDDEGFLSKVLPILGVGAAAWGAGGGTFSQAPSMDQYSRLGDAFKANVPAGLASKLNF